MESSVGAKIFGHDTGKKIVGDAFFEDHKKNLLISREFFFDFFHVKRLKYH